MPDCLNCISSTHLTSLATLFSPKPDIHVEMCWTGTHPQALTRMFSISNQCSEPLTSIGISSFPGAGDVWFSLRGTTYQNNSIVILENFGEGDDALLCKTNQTACCRPPHSGSARGNWFFPNGTRVPSAGNHLDFYRTRGQMVVLLHRRRGGVEGIYRCEIPDAMNVIQTKYIGVYSVSTGEWYMYCTPA